MKYYSLEYSAILAPGALSVGILCDLALSPRVLQAQGYQGYYSPGGSGISLEVRDIRSITDQQFHWLGAPFSVHSLIGGLWAIGMIQVQPQIPMGCRPIVIFSREIFLPPHLKLRLRKTAFL